MSTTRKRRYSSARRSEGAQATRQQILTAAKQLFSRHGIDAVTIAGIARRAGVAGSTVYALFASKAGLLRALMKEALFGPGFHTAHAKLTGVTDPVRLIELTAGVARAIYDGESRELGMLRGASSFSPELRKLEIEFENLRRDMQEPRITRLFDSGRARRGLDRRTAAQIMWMYTGRDIYRMLVDESGWLPERYEAWLARTLVEALVEPTARD